MARFSAPAAAASTDKRGRRCRWRVHQLSPPEPVHGLHVGVESGVALWVGGTLLSIPAPWIDRAALEEIGRHFYGVQR